MIGSTLTTARERAHGHEGEARPLSPDFPTHRGCSTEVVGKGHAHTETHACMQISWNVLVQDVSIHTHTCKGAEEAKDAPNK